VVTAPTPREMSPTEPLFPCTSESESEAAVVQDDVPNWANFDNATPEPEKDESQGWATFAESAQEVSTCEKEVKPQQEELKFDEKSSPPTEKSEPIRSNMPDVVPANSTIEKPAKMPQIQKEESADSDIDGEEVINTTLQTATVHAPSSSDTESENEPESDHKNGDSDSSDTESASGPEDTSTEMPPPEEKKGNIRLPPEDLEPKQLKKLETMKESPA